jgi:hypothetical protein
MRLAGISGVILASLTAFVICAFSILGVEAAYCANRSLSSAPR